ncbi:MAG: hypothetical protein NVV60_00595 [Luteimonas sp.]|nr:hypothetical protein [Luteimonas sp.]
MNAPVLNNTPLQARRALLVIDGQTGATTRPKRFDALDHIDQEIGEALRILGIAESGLLPANDRTRLQVARLRIADARRSYRHAL